MKNQYYKFNGVESNIIFWLNYIAEKNIAQLYVIEEDPVDLNLWKIGESVDVRKEWLDNNCILITDLNEIKRLDKKRLLTGVTSTVVNKKSTFILI